MISAWAPTVASGMAFITGHVIPVEPGQPLVYGPGDYCVWHSPPPPGAHPLGGIS